MLDTTETARLSADPPNSLLSIRTRVDAGLIPWAGPLLLISARFLLLLVSQALAACVLWALHGPSPWHAAGYWWNVYGTLVDIGCLIALRYFTRREGIRMRDLLGPIRLRRGRDVLLGMGYFVLVFPLFVGAGYVSQRLFYGASLVNPGSYVFEPHAMPLWAVVYALTAWWMIWSPTEEVTYQAYALPRIQALSGRTWFAFLVVGFCWAVQHSALPFVPDLRFIAFRTLSFVPGALAMMFIYWRTRRLAPLIVAHWPMDIAGAMMTMVLANMSGR